MRDRDDKNIKLVKIGFNTKEDALDVLDSIDKRTLMFKGKTKLTFETCWK